MAASVSRHLIFKVNIICWRQARISRINQPWASSAFFQLCRIIWSRWSVQLVTLGSTSPCRDALFTLPPAWGHSACESLVWFDLICSSLSTFDPRSVMFTLTTESAAMIQQINPCVWIQQFHFAPPLVMAIKTNMWPLIIALPHIWTQAQVCSKSQLRKKWGWRMETIFHHSISVRWISWKCQEQNPPYSIFSICSLLPIHVPIMHARYTIHMLT